MKSAVSVRSVVQRWRRHFFLPWFNEHGPAVKKLVRLIAVAVLVSVAIFRGGHKNDNVESTPLEISSSQSPFEEVVQRTEEARHGVPTGVPLNPLDEHFLTGREQIGLGIALLLAIGLANRHLAPGVGALLMKRFNPWGATAPPLPVVEEQFVAEFAVQLEMVERGNAEIARSRQEIVDEFIQIVPQKLKDLRNLFAEMSRSPDSAARQKIVGDLHTEVISLKNRVGSLELTPAWQLATSVERLIGQLAEKPANITQSTLRTVAGGLLLLNDLCVPKVRKDLATNPPVRFLAVDDDPISRRVVSMCLKKVAQAPDLAEHGEAALEMAGRQSYDAVFLDVEMPGLDGFEVCTKIHELPTNGLTPVVFVTSHSDFDSRAKSISSGGRELIAKPFLSAEITLKALTLLFRGRLDREKAGIESSKETSSAKADTLKGVEKGETKVAAGAKEQSDKLSAPTKQADSAQVVIARALKKAASKLQPQTNLPAASHAEKPEADAESTKDSRPDAQEFARAFAANGPEHLRQMQEQISALGAANNPTERQEILGDLYVGLNTFRSEAARAGLRTICELASAITKLILKVLEKPTLFTPSVLQAITAASDLLEGLAAARVEVDLANPRLRALVVDDEPLTRRAISNALQLTFGKPDTAENGESAVALAQSKVFDVIFLDIMMPEMDGFETCAKIRETKFNGATPIIFVTTHKDTKSREKSIESGGNGFISKPVLPAEIFLTALTFTLLARMGNSKAALSAAQVLEECVC